MITFNIYVYVCGNLSTHLYLTYHFAFTIFLWVVDAVVLIFELEYIYSVILIKSM